MIKRFFELWKNGKSKAVKAGYASEMKKIHKKAAHQARRGQELLEIIESSSAYKIAIASGAKKRGF